MIKSNHLFAYLHAFLMGLFLGAASPEMLTVPVVVLVIGINILALGLMFLVIIPLMEQH